MSQSFWQNDKIVSATESYVGTPCSDKIWYKFLVDALPAKRESVELGASFEPFVSSFCSENPTITVCQKLLQANTGDWNSLNLCNNYILPPLNDEELRKAIFGGTTSKGTNYACGFPFGDSHSQHDIKAVEALFPFPTILPSFKEDLLMSKLLPFQKNSTLVSKVLSCIQTVEPKSTPLPVVILRECLTFYVKKQVDHIGSQILSTLLRDWKLMDELGVLRDVYLLGSGDLLQHFLTVVFKKLDKGESWDDDFELNTVLQVSGRVFWSRNYVAEDIEFGSRARAAMLRGVNQLAEAVKVTMGPKGRNVIIERNHGSPKVTKDGVTVARSINFEEKAKNIGADLVKQVASATNSAAGDGTTCATVLTQAIFSEGCKSVAAGVNVMDLRSGISMAVKAVITDLKNQALMISTSEEITQVATISANGEREIGELIARAMEKVGKEGVITVADGNTLDNELEVVEGMKLGRGYISPYFVTDTKTQKCELEHPLIFIHDKKISDVNSLVRILELAVEKRRPLLIVAEDLDSDLLAMLIINKHQAGVKVCAIKAPGFGDNRRANLEDLAVLTGGEVISEERGLTLNDVRLDKLGTAKKVTISLDDTIILHGGGDKKQIEERCEELRSTIENSTTMFDKEKAQERLSKLSGGVAVFKVGGASEAEVGERKDRVTDALNATRAAIEEGIVPGGGVALLYATRVLKDLQTVNEDQKRGVEIVENALKAPTFTIVSNAGGDASMVLGKLLEQDDLRFGFDAAQGKYVDMVKAGIIDPLKVVRTALVDASSVSLLLTTTEATIVDRQGEKNPLANRMPNMDDMGMGF